MSYRGGSCSLLGWLGQRGLRGSLCWRVFGAARSAVGLGSVQRRTGNRGWCLIIACSSFDGLNGLLFKKLFGNYYSSKLSILSSANDKNKIIIYQFLIIINPSFNKDQHGNLHPLRKSTRIRSLRTQIIRRSQHFSQLRPNPNRQLRDLQSNRPPQRLPPLRVLRHRP